jgi:hypothetical protein
MRKAYQVLAYVLAAEVLVQAMAIAYAIAGVGKWVDDGGTLTKAVIEDDSSNVGGVVGFMIHGINGQMLIPLITIALLVVSFFAKIDGGVRRAAIIFGMIVLQVVLGIASHSIPFVILLHVINAFGILVMAFLAGQSARTTVASHAAVEAPVAV